MVEVLMLATVIAPVTTAIVEVIKRATGINKRYLPLIAVIIGIGIGAGAQFLAADLILRIWAGGISGLAATGLFELNKNSREDERNSE